MDNIYNPENKEIQFIDTHYNELFRIPDGGFVTITHPNGEQAIRKCQYLDEMHLKLGYCIFHCCELAEKLEQNGSVCTPCPEPEIVSGYVVTDRKPVGDAVFVMAHNPNAPEPWVTWQGKMALKIATFGDIIGKIAQTRGEICYVESILSVPECRMTIQNSSKTEKEMRHDEF